MGLSDEERKKNIIECIDAITNIEPFTTNPNDSKFEQINIILENLWYDLFGTNGNSFHWFAGSSSDNITLAQDDIFGLAIINSYYSDSEIKSEIKKNNPFDNTDADKVWGPESKEWFDYSNRFKPTDLSILKNYNDWYGRAYQANDILLIFKYIESYFYNVNRYQDELTKAFKPLTIKISKLKGLCFKIMSENDIYFKAFASNIIFDKILPFHADDINKWFMNNYLHHHVRIEFISNEELLKALAVCQKNHFDKSIQKLKSNHRMILILKFCLKFFSEKYAQTNLFKFIEEHNNNFPTDKIVLNEVNKLLKKAEENSSKEEKRDPYWNCDLTGENYYKSNKK